MRDVEFIPRQRHQGRIEKLRPHFPQNRITRIDKAAPSLLRALASDPGRFGRVTNKIPLGLQADTPHGHSAPTGSRSSPTIAGDHTKFDFSSFRAVLYCGMETYFSRSLKAAAQWS